MKDIVTIAKEVNGIVEWAKKDFKRAEKYLQYSGMAYAKAFENGANQALDKIREAIADDLKNNPNPIKISKRDMKEIGL